MKNCLQCGAENRDAAKFCLVCGAGLPAAAPPTAISPAAPPTKLQPPPAVSPYQQGIPGMFPPSLPPAPQVEQQIVPQPGKKSQRRWSLHGCVQAEGRVSIADPPRETRLPFDPARAMVVTSIVLVFIGVLAAAFMAALTLFIVLLFFGFSLCLLPMLVPLLGGIFGPILYILRGKKTAPMIDFQVEDEFSGTPVSVVLYQKEGATSVRLGDRVQIFGRRQWGSKAIRAHRISVLETGGHPTKYNVPGIRPWPWWVGVITLGAVVLGGAYLYYGDLYIP
jgi:hypothetical protein